MLLAVRATHAGALWRDEAASVATATLPNFSELLHYFQFESFPLPYDFGLRGYIAVAGNSDASLRVFGALVGVSLLLVGWWSARRLGAGVPLVFLALGALSPTFLMWGTTIRGYGIGSVLIVFAFSATANFLAYRTSRSAILMAIAFIAAVQCVVINTALVFAICLSGIAVCFARAEHKSALIIAGALGVAAFSFLPYIGTYSKMGWHVLLQTSPSLTELWEAFCDTLGLRTVTIAIGWLALTLTAAISGISYLAKRAASPLPIFGVLVALASFVGAFIFLKLLGYDPREWYFVSLICLLAGALELTIVTFPASAVVRIVRLFVCIVAVAGACWSSWPTLTKRQSNVDLISNWLTTNAHESDLIVVNPWSFGVSFNRYYHGAVPWITVPLLSDRRFHRYDLLQTKVSENDPLKDLKTEIERTLRNGGRIYLVGGALWLGKNERAVVLPPAPESQYGWSYLPYVVSWSQQVAEFLLAHVNNGVTLPEFGEHINPGEDILLCQLEGWHD